MIGRGKVNLHWRSWDIAAYGHVKEMKPVETNMISFVKYRGIYLVYDMRGTLKRPSVISQTTQETRMHGQAVRCIPQYP